MAIRKIVMLGDEVLRERSKEVTVFDAKLFELIDDMKETLFDARGAGLAAPQVGILKRVALVSVDGETIYELINPRIVKMSGTQIEQEGCLSIPDKCGYVERPLKLTVAAQDRFGKPVKHVITDAYTSVAFCHEIDHLDGILYTDKVIANYVPPKDKK